MKDKNIFEIKNYLCVRNVTNVNSVFWIEKEPWGADCIMIIVNDGVFICTCNVKYDEYKCWTKHAFVYDSYFKLLHQSICFGAIIDNRADAFFFGR